MGEKDIALLKTITKAELQAYFEGLFFKENRANRFDMHWNSQPHIKQAAEGASGAETTAETTQAAAQEGGAAQQEEAKFEESPSEPDIEPTYESEKQHRSVNQFKKSLGLFVDNFKLNYATKEFRL